MQKNVEECRRMKTNEEECRRMQKNVKECKECRKMQKARMDKIKVDEKEKIINHLEKYMMFKLQFEKRQIFQFGREKAFFEERNDMNQNPF